MLENHTSGNFWDALELSDCNLTHWLLVAMGCVAAMSEGMGISKKTRHNGLLHLLYNIFTSKCCCPDTSQLQKYAEKSDDEEDDDASADDENETQEEEDEKPEPPKKKKKGSKKRRSRKKRSISVELTSQTNTI